MNLSNYQQISFQDNEQDLQKTVDIQRKCLAQMLGASCESLDNINTCNLLESKLKKYSNIVGNESNVYEIQLNNSLGNNTEPKQFKSRLNEINKKKLGTRRNINSKFVSPLLSNSESNEEIKSDEWPSDSDERLKNIEPKMVELIKSEIIDCGPNIHWDDIAGLAFAKVAIQEAVVWPLLRPDIFTGLRRPPKGILLFGPPGTGKTLIGKCVASQSKSTFFSISASSLTSKWVGDGEKMVRALFAVARVHQPAHLYFDEKNCRAIVKIPYNLTSNVHFSLDTKSKSPLGNLIAKDAVDKVQETSEEESKKQREKAWRTMKRTLAFFGISFTCLGGYLIFTLGSPEKDLNGNPIKDNLADRNIILQYIIRTYRELDYYKKLIKEPSREKLLPDPLEYPYLQPKYTLVLELTDVLVHPDWTYNTGWRFKKRPLLDYFLESLHGSYEIVIYTAEQGMTVFPLIDAIDPKNIIAYKLVRDATHFTDGHHVKSLNNLNRDLAKVICVDWNAKSVKFNKENLLQIKKWDGHDNDTALIDLAALLKAIVDNEIEDVREVLQYYSKYDDPVAEFREKQKRLIEDLEAQAATKREQETASKAASNWKPNIFSRKSF
ncbi:hypothetical protein JTB14_033557 [Gonioctena quinquepunctata]|nr:hypothetical protein JTB14_033557 [Gonioctena quinquepunctata]